LIVLDEIGRGTATYDGISIAAAVTRYIYNKIGARTLFATHYHELTALEKQFRAFQNSSMEIVEEKDAIHFTYKFVTGPADKSYGIHVAKMAGLPSAVIDDASRWLERFEKHHAKRQEENREQMALFE